MEKLRFEIKDAGNFVRLEPHGLISFVSGSDNDWDNNFIKTSISIRAGAFSANYFADMQTVDFESFKHALHQLHDNLKGTAAFHCLEDDLTLNITGDGLGHFTVQGEAFDQNSRNRLVFEISFDQTYLMPLVLQLDNITKQFPITGETFSIKNKYIQ